MLKTVGYIGKIVVTMGQTDAGQFEKAKHFFSKLPQESVILWNTGPRITKLTELLRVNIVKDFTAG